jgi:putative ABC transport system permease protein
MIWSDIIFQLSVRSVRLHFLRSVLAALGIVIGVVAISSMGMMGTNMTLSVTEQLSSMGNIITVTPSTGNGGGGGPGMPGESSGSSSSDDYISDSQFKDIKRASGQELVYYVYSDSDSFDVGPDSGRTRIYGLDPEVIPEILVLTDGSYPKSTSGVLIGPSLAERYDLTVGSRIKIGDEDEGPQSTVRVVGIIEERGMTMDINTDSSMVVTEKFFTSMYGDEGEYDQVIVIADNIDDVTAIKEEIDRQLNKKDNEVNVQDSSRMLTTITSTLGTLTSFVMAIAGISLLVAAVSIFNVMMMSVTERVREIGILRSIGTRRSVVRRMFVYESFILGVAGAVIGAVLSLFIGYFVVLGMTGTTEYFFYPQSIVYIPAAMAVGIVICVLSGIYPAWKAANLDPIDALRAE